MGVLALCAVETASGQAVWTFGGVNFPARDGWCSKFTDQGTPTAPAPAIELRQCGKDFPYLSMSIGQKSEGRGAVDVSGFADKGYDFAAGPEARKLVMGLATTQHGVCKELTYQPKRDPVPGVSGFAVEASFDCADHPGQSMWIRNFTAYASSKSGDPWIVSFDYPLAAITGGDVAMMQSAIASIQTH